MNIAVLSDIHGNYIALEACLDYLSDMREAGLYEAAPYWTGFTELLVTGRCGKYTHAGMLSLAMNICYEKKGECNWPQIPEECFAEAFEIIQKGDA